MLGGREPLPRSLSAHAEGLPDLVPRPGVASTCLGGGALHGLEVPLELGRGTKHLERVGVAAVNQPVPR